jgi:hypothetical protein
MKNSLPFLALSSISIFVTSAALSFKTAFAASESLQLSCEIHETLLGDFKHATVSQVTIDFHQKKPTTITLQKVKKINLQITAAGGRINQTPKAEILIELTDLETGSKSHSIVLLNSEKSEASGSSALIFSRKNKDAVAIDCELIENKK